MKNNKSILDNLSQEYIEGTDAEAVVADVTVFVCHVSNKIVKVLKLQESHVYMNTKALKHMYDSKPAQEYDFLLRNINKIVKRPDKIYWNKSEKRGDYCFVKMINGFEYLCSLEYLAEDEKSSQLCIVTAFKLRKPRYLDHYKLLWVWGSDISPS